MEAARKSQMVNGVDVGQLFNTIDLIKEKPDVAKGCRRNLNSQDRGIPVSGLCGLGKTVEDDCPPRSFEFSRR